jgi:RNA polymerase sigma-70 factor, ECF subfamily
MQGTLTREITIRIKSGDERSFALIFHAWYGSLLHFCMEYVVDFEAARNIVQNVFLKLWERRELLDEDSNLKAFLYVMAKNEAISHLRHLKTEAGFQKNARKFSPDLELNLGAISDLDFNKIDIDQISSVIESVISSLPERCQEVFRMSRYEELKNKEIAERLQISEKAVEANITRALKTLKEKLKNYLGSISFLIGVF